MPNTNRANRSDLAGQKVEDRIVVKLRTGGWDTHALGLDHMCAQFMEHGRSAPLSPLFVSRYLPLAVIRVPGADPIELARALRIHPNVEYADPILTSLQGLTMPNDPKFVADPAPLQSMNVPAAWDVTTGSPDVLVAVIDSGLPVDSQGNLLHEDLNDARYILGPNLWGSGVPNDSVECGHGTHVTGIVAAMTGNGIGVAGVNWRSPVYVCKVYDQDAEPFDDGRFHQAVEDILTFAATRGIKRVVINCSFGGSPSNCLLETCKLVHDQGAILCAAIGNNDLSLCPGAYADGAGVSVIAVGAIDRGSALLPGSARGATVVATAESICSTWPPSTYATQTGTSGATPFVSGIASLVWSAHPEYSHLDVIARIKQTATPLSRSAPVPDELSGWGIVNAGKAVGP